MKGLLLQDKIAAVPESHPFADARGASLHLALSFSLLMIMLGTATPPSVAATAKKPAAKGTTIDRNPALSKANALSLARKYTEAIEQYKLAVVKEPGNYQCFQMYGRTLCKMGMIDEALDQYQKGFKLKPNDAELCNDIGVALFVNDRWGDGARYLKKATQLSPRYIAAYNNLGVALQKLGDFNQAHEAYTTSLKLQPTNAQIVKRLDAILSKMDESKPFDFGGPVDASTLSRPVSADTATTEGAATAKDPKSAQADQKSEEEQKAAAAEPVKTPEPTTTATTAPKTSPPADQTVIRTPTVREPVRRAAPTHPTETAVRKTPARAKSDRTPPVAVSHPFSNKSAGMEDISTSLPGLPVSDKPSKTSKTSNHGTPETTTDEGISRTIPSNIPAIPPSDPMGTAGTPADSIVPPSDTSASTSTSPTPADPTATGPTTTSAAGTTPASTAGSSSTATDSTTTSSGSPPASPPSDSATSSSPPPSTTEAAPQNGTTGTSSSPTDSQAGPNLSTPPTDQPANNDSSVGGAPSGTTTPADPAETTTPPDSATTPSTSPTPETPLQ